MREARLSLLPIEGTRWSARSDRFSPNVSPPPPHAARLHQALMELEIDLPIAEFLETHFADRQYSELRQAIKRMVEGYDAADPDRASTFALRDEWMGHGLGRQGRIAGGYGALIKFLVSECRRQGASIHLGSAVTAIDESRRRSASARRYVGVS
jgi:phytoene dehydrogenase-like protein